MSEQTPDTVPSPSPSGDQVTRTVAERLATCGQSVFDRVVDVQVETVLAERVGLASHGVKKLEALTAEFTKTNKPDQQTFSAPGQPPTESYSKARNDQIGKLNKQIADWKNALDKAFATPCDYGPLTKLVNSDKGGGNKDKKDDKKDQDADA